MCCIMIEWYLSAVSWSMLLLPDKLSSATCTGSASFAESAVGKLLINEESNGSGTQLVEENVLVDSLWSDCTCPSRKSLRNKESVEYGLDEPL